MTAPTVNRTRPSAMLGPVVAACALAAGVLVIALRNPYAPGGGIGECTFHLATGLWCPGCGGTRAVYSLAHGDVVGAFAMHPLLVIATPLLAVLWWRWLQWARGRSTRPWGFQPWHGAVLAAVLVTFSVLRNVPLFAPVLAP